MTKGTIFDLERFSTADGPGIRTTAFFKGCNMHCPWCHNAEGIRFRKQLRFEPDRCIGCGACVAVCPQGAHEMRSGKHDLNRNACLECFRCAQACFSGALEVVGKEYEAEALAQLLLEDAIFYQNSGGGVTLSGGEVLCQAEFAREVLSILQKAGVHTAIETNLSLPWNAIHPVMQVTDLVMADLKAMDAKKHRQATGLSNDTVLENLILLSKMHKPIILRTPVIPGFNDTATEISAIAAWAVRHLPSMAYYELLPYHPLGCEKPALLGEKVLPMALKPPEPEHMRALAKAASAAGAAVRISGKQFEEK